MKREARGGMTPVYHHLNAKRRARRVARSVANAIPTLRRCERALGLPAAQWAGRCFEISSRIVADGLVHGVAVYGHFLGRVATDSYFGRLARRTRFYRHGWILLADGRVLDPTRFAFDGRAPYLHVGPLSEEYDEGGNRMLRAQHGPPPAYEEFEQQYDVPVGVLPSAPWTRVERMLGIDVSVQEPGVLSESQVRWLANAPYDALEPHAEAIYAAIVRIGCAASIPIDNRRRAERAGAKLSKKEG